MTTSEKDEDGRQKVLCSSCKQVESVMILRHRHFCKPCASKFIVQKFKRQMGTLTAFFETQKRDTKGRLSRILVIADSNIASQVLVMMLQSYYSKNDAQDKYLDNRLPDVKILDTANPVESKLIGWKYPHWMECMKVAAGDNVPERIGLAFENGKILQSKVANNEEISFESALNGFATDSRGEASSILWEKTISSFARRGSYDVILYPETATRIASKVLTLTSQGRGFTVPWECGSFVKMPNGVYSARPLKDLSDTEIKAYLDIFYDIPLSTSTEGLPSAEQNSSSHNIAEMMINYISSLETSFPSIVATTGRTADKLELPAIDNADPPCMVCSMPKRSDNVKEWLDNITVTQAAPEAENVEILQAQEPICNRKDVTGDLCYGCYTLFRSSRGIVEWPV